MTRWLREHGSTLGIAALLTLVLMTRCAMPAYAVHPPMLLIVEQDTVLYAPGGQRVSIPAGAELDMCAQDGTLMHYELEPMVIRIPAPCQERPLFADGFEG